MKKILLVAHAPSPNTQRLAQAALSSLNHPELEQVQGRWLPPLECDHRAVQESAGILLGTPENLGYMSGALKDFFDRIYYPCLEICQGKPVAMYIRAGQDGTGTRRAVESICTGLKWKWALAPLVLQGPWQDTFESECSDLALNFAAGIDAGIF